MEYRLDSRIPNLPAWRRREQLSHHTRQAGQAGRAQHIHQSTLKALYDSSAATLSPHSIYLVFIYLHSYLFLW